MIKAVLKSELSDCLKVLHEGYETVAIEFGLTDENCPDRGHASLPYDKLLTDFENETLMFGYFCEDKIIGFLGMKVRDNGICNIDDIVVIPEYRHKGYGKELLSFSKQKARELGAVKIVLGMIEDNKVLRKWYEDNGFINIGYKKYEGAPFTVGKMECKL